MRDFFYSVFISVFLTSLLAGPSGPVAYPNVVEITAEELQEGLYGYDLFDVLAALRLKTGLTVKSSSDIGAEDWLLIRGYPRDSARNVLVLVDGMPLNDALSGANEFEHLPPLDMIEKILIYKPPLPARFGGAMAAIEVWTRQDFRPWRGELSAAYGGYDSGFGSAAGEAEVGPWSFSANVDYLNTDNLSGIRRTPPREDQVYGNRSYWIVKPAFKLRYRFSDRSNLSFFSQYIDSRKFFSDEEFRGQKEFRDRELVNFNLVYRWTAGPRFEMTAAGYRSDEAYRLNLRMHPNVRDQKRVAQGVKVDASLHLPLRQTLSFGGNWTDFAVDERLEQPLEVDSGAVLGLYLEDQIQVLDHLWLTLGVRHDDHSEAEARLNPSLSAVFQPTPRVTVFGMWGRSTRWPGLSEFDIEDPVRGLQGESLQGLEWGGQWEVIPEKVSARFSFFKLELEDEAQFVMDRSLGRPRFWYRNSADPVESQGLEAEVQLFLSPGWSAFLNYTHNTVENRADGSPVDFGGPENLFNGGLAYRNRRFSVQGALRCGDEAAGVQGMGGSATRLDSWCLVDAAGSLELSRGFGLVTRISNLLDSLHETFDGRPMFGRVATIGLRWRWGDR